MIAAMATLAKLSPQDSKEIADLEELLKFSD